MATSNFPQVTNNSGSNANGNYCKMPDGTLIQYGKTSSFSVYTDVSLPIKMNNTSYSVVGVDNSGYHRNVMIGTLLQSKFPIYTSGSESGTCTWIAIGRWK